MFMTWYENTLSVLSPGWVGSLIGLAGLASAIVVYLLTRKRTSLAFAYVGDHLLGSSSNALPPGISVQYEGRNIPRLTKSVIVLWNRGENTVMGSDIVDRDSLRFHVGTDGAILSIMPLQLTRTVNDFWIKHPAPHAPNEAEFGFNFLDTGDGVVVEILHTSEKRIPEIKGTLRGLPKGLKNFGRVNRSRTSGRNNTLKRNLPARLFMKLLNSTSTYLPIAAGVVVLLASIISPEGASLSSSPGVQKGPPAFVVILAFAYILLGLTMIYLGRRKYPKTLHVDALE